MEKNILSDFLNMIKDFASEALKECEPQEEVVACDNVQVTAEDVCEDSIATTKGNEEKCETPVEPEVEAEVQQVPVEESTVLEAADETEGNPDELKNVEVPEEKSDEERLFETAEQLCAIAEQIYKRSEPMTKKQSSYVAKTLAKHAQRIAKYCTKK
jgi:hypothetical protein